MIVITKFSLHDHYPEEGPFEVYFQLDYRFDGFSTKDNKQSLVILKETCLGFLRQFYEKEIKTHGTNIHIENNSIVFGPGGGFIMGTKEDICNHSCNADRFLSLLCSIEAWNGAILKLELVTEGWRRLSFLENLKKLDYKEDDPETIKKIEKVRFVFGLPSGMSNLDILYQLFKDQREHFLLRQLEYYMIQSFVAESNDRVVFQAMTKHMFREYL